MREGGVLVCWGLDDLGQASPPEDGQFIAIASGYAHSCGIREDLSLTCWGAENFAKAYPEDERFVSVDIGSLITCGIREDGIAVCWGDIYGSPDILDTPYSDISIGFFSICGLLENGSPVCRGPEFGGEPLVPQTLQDERFVSISSGMLHTCALRADGSPVCWGGNAYGESSPPAGETLGAISSGGEHTCALRSNDTPVCWGRDTFGQATPPDDEVFMAISSGREHTCALRFDGVAICWGKDYDGQATPITGNEPTPETMFAMGELLWRFRFPSNEDMASNPTVSDGAIYVTLHDNALYKLDASNGSVVWSYFTDYWITSSPVVINGVVYAGSWDGFVYALDSETGELRWRYETSDRVYYPLTVVDDTIYAGSGSNVYALRASTGELIWTSGINGPVSFSPSLFGDVVYAGTLTGFLYALESSTGKELWRYNANEESYSVSASGGKVYFEVFTAPTVIDQTIYIGTDSGYVRALDASNGSLLWEYDASGYVDLSPIVKGNVVYAVGSSNGTLHAIDSVTGELVWSDERGHLIHAIAVGRSLVYINGFDGGVPRLYGFDTASGELRWQARGESLFEPIVIDGVIYAVRTAQGEDRPVDGIYALDAETGETLWRYHSDVHLGRPAALANGVIYVSPTENFYDKERGYTGWYLYAVAVP